MLSCGAGPSVPPQTLVSAATQSTPSAAGDWEIKAQSAVSSGSTPFSPFSRGYWELVGSLENTDAKITGMLNVFTSLCYPPGINLVPVSGTIGAGSDVSLTSSPVGGQVLTIAGVMSSDRRALLNATYVIEGGCGDGEHGTMTGFMVPSFTNTYTGTLTSFPAGKATNVTLSLTQSPGADAAGFFHVTSGPATFVNSTCFSSGTLSPARSLIFGSHLAVTFDTNDGGQVILDTVLADPSDKIIAGTYRVLSGSCAGEGGTVTLDHP